MEAAFGAQPGNIQASVDYLFSSEYIGWTNITNRVIGPAVQGRIKTKRGRPYQLQQQETGTAEIPLSNVDGAATPTNPGSPWYSNALNANMSFQAGWPRGPPSTARRWRSPRRSRSRRAERDRAVLGAGEDAPRRGRPASRASSSR